MATHYATPTRSFPPHLVDAELEDEFVCSMIRAAQRIEGSDGDWAGDYFFIGLDVQPSDLISPKAREVYRGVMEVVESGGIPAWSIVRNHLLEQRRLDAAKHVPILLAMSTGLISAIPTWVERLQALAKQRAA